MSHAGIPPSNDSEKTLLAPSPSRLEPAGVGCLPYLQSVATLSHETRRSGATLRNRGIDFVDAERISRGVTLTAEGTREAYGERRFLTLGLLEDQVVSVAHTKRGEDIRIISIRKATKHEARCYLPQIVD